MKNTNRPKAGDFTLGQKIQGLKKGQNQQQATDQQQGPLNLGVGVKARPRIQQTPQQMFQIAIKRPAEMSELRKLQASQPTLKSFSTFKQEANSMKSNALDNFIKTQIKSVPYAGMLNAASFISQNQSYTKKSQRITQYDKYFKALEQQLTLQGSTKFKELGGVWDAEKKMWQLPDNKIIKKRLDVDKRNRKIVANSQFNQQILNSQITAEQAEKNIPAVIKAIVTSNNTLSQYGIGKVSKNSLPFYAGRYMDPFTGRIKTMQMMSQKYLNPFSYSQHLQYLESKIIFKWNSFVRAEEQYANFLGTTPGQFGGAERKSIQQALSKQNAIQNAFNSLAKQVQLWRLSLPVAQNIDLVCQQFLNQGAQKAKAFFQIVYTLGFTAKRQYWSAAKIQAQRKLYLDQLKKAYQNIAKPVENASPQQISLYAKKTAAFALWANKGMGSTQRALKKLVRTLIPETLKPQEVQTVINNLKSADQKIDQVVGRLQKDQSGQIKGVPSDLKAAKNVEQFIKSITDFKPSGTQVTIPIYKRPVKGKVNKDIPVEVKVRI